MIVTDFCLDEEEPDSWRQINLIKKKTQNIKFKGKNLYNLLLKWASMPKAKL